jgi:hypothetical protein
MGMYYGSEATKTAADVVTAALGSGALKLLGPTHQDDVQVYAKADAAYLAALINQLAEQLKAD